MLVSAKYLQEKYHIHNKQFYRWQITTYFTPLPYVINPEWEDHTKRKKGMCKFLYDEDVFIKWYKNYKEMKEYKKKKTREAAAIKEKGKAKRAEERRKARELRAKQNIENKRLKAIRRKEGYRKRGEKIRKAKEEKSRKRRELSMAKMFDIIADERFEDNLITILEYYNCSVLNKQHKQYREAEK